MLNFFHMKPAYNINILMKVVSTPRPTMLLVVEVVEPIVAEVVVLVLDAAPATILRFPLVVRATLVPQIQMMDLSVNFVNVLVTPFMTAGIGLTKNMCLLVMVVHGPTILVQRSPLPLQCLPTGLILIGILILALLITSPTIQIALPLRSAMVVTIRFMLLMAKV
jgi:hypothetical protein